MGLLFDQLCSFENLWSAWQKAARHKADRPDVAAFAWRAADRLLNLQLALRAQSWQPHGYRHFFVHEPKRRKISAAPFEDRIVHHALVNVLEPLLEPRMSPYSFANRRGLGTHAAVWHCAQACQRHAWALRADVVQHFAALDHAVLTACLRRFIDDEAVLRLAELIMRSGQGVLADQYDNSYFAGDDLLAACRPRGLPIGNMTSQFWSNVVMSDIDAMVSRELRCPAYARYVDDMVLFADNPQVLQHWRKALIERLGRLRLKIHEHACQPQPTAQGVPWLGFVVYPSHVQLKSRCVVRFTRQLRRKLRAWSEGKLSTEQLNASVQGWVAHAEQARSWRLREQLFSVHPWPPRQV